MEENKTNNLPVPVCHELQERLGHDVDMRKLSADIRKASEYMAVAFQMATKSFKTMVQVIAKYMRESVEWIKASSWAGVVHAKWLTIYHRTKKRRIKKKYRDRIMRAYRAEMAKQEADRGL